MEKNKIYQGSSLKVLKTFPNESIDLCVTSPPYWGLRNYGTDHEVWDGNEECEHTWDKDFCSKCGAWKGELGLEPNPELYIKHLTDIFREVKRVLKPTGTLWINIGDSYAGSGKAGNPDKEYYDRHTIFNTKKEIDVRKGMPIKKFDELGIKAKDLIGIPWMLAFSLRSDGWYLRQDIIWAKATSGDIRMGSVMPESVTDRCSKSHEYIFLFSKSRNYYFDYLSIQEPLKESIKVRYQSGWNGNEEREYPFGSERAKNTEKGNRRSVWFTKLKPFKEAHFAIFPENLIYPIIEAGCPIKVCSTCRKPYSIILKKESVSNERGKNSSDHRAIGTPQRSNCYSIVESVEKVPSCSCESNKKFEAGIVLDPFFGSGTTGVVAKKLNLFYIGIEINEKYIDIAEKRLKQVLPLLF